MIPVITAARLSGAKHRADRPLLVLGPSIGTSARSLWGDCATHLTDAFDVFAWDLPGHGHNRTVPAEPFTMAELATGVLRVVDDLLAERGELSGTFFYAGVSVGGCVGLQLLVDAPARVPAAVLLCTGARIASHEAWAERIGEVTDSGTSELVSGSRERWFGPGLLDTHPERGSALLEDLRLTDDDGYIQVCAALADFDLRDRLIEISVPVLAIAGSRDGATPTDSLRQLAEHVQDGRLVELEGVAHLAPAEAPDVVARLLREHLLGEVPSEHRDDTRTVREVREAGLAVRREVLGDAHVDLATAASTDFTEEFQELITQYAWGTIWTRPGLDRRSRSLITLTALIARGHHEELALHLRAARTNGLTDDEIKELLLQTAIYCGVPDANTAFRIAQQVLSEQPSEGDA